MFATLFSFGKWPRSSSTPTVACSGLGSWFVAIRGVFPSLSPGPDARHHGWYVPEGHVRSWLVLLVTLLALCCLRCRQAQMIGIMAGMAQKDSYAATQLCLAGFAGDDTARAVFPDKGLDVPVVCNVRSWP